MNSNGYTARPVNYKRAEIDRQRTAGRRWTSNIESRCPLFFSSSLKMEIKAYRFVAYTALTFSVVAVLAVCITLPMVFDHVHHLKKTMNREVRFCHVSHYLPKWLISLQESAKDIWDEVNQLKSIPANRTARQSGYDTGAAQVEGGGGGSCSECCQPGAAGPSGTPGRPGNPGRPGAPGRPGNVSQSINEILKLVKYSARTSSPAAM